MKLVGFRDLGFRVSALCGCPCPDQQPTPLNASFAWILAFVGSLFRFHVVLWEEKYDYIMSKGQPLPRQKQTCQKSKIRSADAEAANLCAAP